MSKKEVHIFCDVDGVLNAFPYSSKDSALRRLAEQTGWSNYEQGVAKAAGRSFLITYAPELIERINTLASRDGVIFHWLTTWCDDAPTSLAPLVGLEGDHVVIGADHFKRLGHYASPWWKLQALQEFWDGDTSFVWIDDDWQSTRPEGQWCASLAEDGQELLVVTPHPDLALTREEWEGIERFVNDQLEEDAA